MYCRWVIVLFSVYFFSGCVLPQKRVMTPLELQSLQMRKYESSKEVVFPSVISVFQDLGYTILNASKDTGLISAESTTKSNPWMRVMSGLSQNSKTRATAFIETIKKSTRVRLNFVMVVQTSSQHGQSDRRDESILDAAVYQNAFERIESAIFLRSNN